jgi:hypothetical protein
MKKSEFMGYRPVFMLTRSELQEILDTASEDSQLYAEVSEEIDRRNGLDDAS